ncbi:MAG: AMP-binding protein [Planctomycetaceae bacterium]|nr:AMP-binding protein [Planctomycetaceae bacterium]
MSSSANIAARLSEFARQIPENPAVVQCRRGKDGTMHYDQITIGELDRQSDQLAQALIQQGLKPGQRMVLMVPPGLKFFSLTFALFKAGAIVVLIDPGMGRTRIFECLEEIAPDGFIGIPLVQFVRSLSRRRFPHAQLNVTVGRRWLWGGTTFDQLLAEDVSGIELPEITGEDSAAIIFTSGSTGPPKGVLYEHGMFCSQVEQLQDFFSVQPGEVDLAAFPLFALFDAGMGVTSVIPDMNPTRPADVEPENILDPIRDFQISQAFGSPALWNRVSKYCVEHDLTIPHLKRITSAGAPLPLPILKRMHSVLEEPTADMFPPYGATESLPIACLAGREMVGEIGQRTIAGAGTCVGKPFPKIQVRIIGIVEGPINSPAEMRDLPAGEIGEIVVSGEVVTKEYYRQPEATRLGKIVGDAELWHRVGDVGYLDEQGLLWFCGRKAHIVSTSEGPLYTEQCEPVFNEHSQVYRTALVGVGESNKQRAVIVVERESDCRTQSAAERDKLIEELRILAQRHSHTSRIETFLFHDSLPVDIRHNVKINREELAIWAAQQLRTGAG